jgi:dephospho-CoA kinase
MAVALIVGITGGIGSGKSAVTDRLEALGICIVDADVVARKVVEPGQPALAAIAAHFGTSVIQEDGSLNRTALRKIVFENPEERQWLEGITHPAIREEIHRQLQAATSPYVVLSSPLLLEAKQNTFADVTVVVDVSEHTQLSRTMARDDNSAELVQQIMAAQMAREERLQQADIVIDNSTSLEDLHQRIDDLHAELLLRAGTLQS